MVPSEAVGEFQKGSYRFIEIIQGSNKTHGNVVAFSNI